MNLNGGIFKGKRIISEATMEQMFSPAVRPVQRRDRRASGVTKTAGFGLTWWVQVRDGERYFAHSGERFQATPLFCLGIGIGN